MCPSLRPLIEKACSDILPRDPKCSCIQDAIFSSDSSCATKGVGARFNNPGNHRCLGERGYLPSGCKKARYGWYAEYQSLQESIVNSVALYGKLYAGKHPLEITRVWSSSLSPHYVSAIQSCYN